MTYSEAKRRLVENKLEEILASTGFTHSAQLCNFLEFVVTRALDGKTGDIKGYTIGVDALGKPEDFDPQTDPSVRVMAGRLRQALLNFNYENPASGVIITIPKGSYVPEFDFSDKKATARQRSNSVGKPTGTGVHSFSNAGKTMFAASMIFSALAAGLMGYIYWHDKTRHPQLELPPAKTLTLEESHLPALAITISIQPDNLPDWITPERIRSSTLTSFSRFNEYRIVDADEATANSGSVFPDYKLSMLFSKAENTNDLLVYLTLYNAPDAEVIWSDKLAFSSPDGYGEIRNYNNTAKIVSAMMSPYGVIYGDIINREAPPPRLNCIREVYSYFSFEQLQSYSNGLDCTRRIVNSGNASSSVHAILAFLYVEAYRKSIRGIAPDPVNLARTEATAALRLDPKNARAYQALFAVEKVRGNKEGAFAAAETALSLNPFDRDIIGDYAAYLVSQNRLSQAERHLVHAMELTPVPPAWLLFYNFLHADLSGDTTRADRLAADFNPDRSSLLAVAAILSAHRRNLPAKLSKARTSLARQQPDFAREPEAALLRRGFETGLAAKLADRLLEAGLGFPVVRLNH